MPPSGQGLWLYLMTGPHTTAIPGLFRAGRAGLAEELGWTLEAFDEAFAEVFQQGMVKADWASRVVWIPNAIKHNPPASPNVVTMWARELDLVPECELKTAAAAGIATALGAMNEAYLAAFTRDEHPPKPSGKATRKPSSKPSPKSSPDPKAIQDQEQDQRQQEQDTLALTACALPAAPFITLPLNDGSEFSISAEQVVQWQGLYPAADVQQELRKYRGWADASPSKRKTRFGILRSVNAWLAKAHDTSEGSGETNGNRAQQRTEGNVANAAKVLQRITGGANPTR